MSNPDDIIEQAEAIVSGVFDDAPDAGLDPFEFSQRIISALAEANLINPVTSPGQHLAHSEAVEDLAVELFERSHEPPLPDDGRGMWEAREWAQRISRDLAFSGLPGPGDGCVCTGHSHDYGGYVEYLMEYDPSCPEHSVHVWNPRTGAWEHAEPDRTQVVFGLWGDQGRSE